MTSLSNVRAPHASERALRCTPNRAGATSGCAVPLSRHFHCRAYRSQHLNCKKNFPRVFCLPYLLTFCLACVCVQTWRTASGADCIRSSRYGVLVQAWPTASGARDIVFGPRLGPLHPELAEEKAKRRRMRRRSNNKRKKKKKMSCTFVRI